MIENLGENIWRDKIYERSLKSEPSIVKPGETYRESKRTLIKANFVSS